MYAAKPTFGYEGTAKSTLGVYGPGISIEPEPWTTPGWNTLTNIDAASQVVKLYDFIMVWTNPISTQFPKYDGFAAQMVADIGTDNKAPNLKFQWLPNTTPATTILTKKATKFDLKPTAISTFDGTLKNNFDAPNPIVPGDETINDDIFIKESELGTNLCIEIWKYSDYAQGCVKIKGTLSRKFITDDTNNGSTVSSVLQDMTLDYLEIDTYTGFGNPETVTPS